MHNCTHCNQTFETKRGLNGHLNSISENSKKHIEEKKKQNLLIKQEKELLYLTNPEKCHTCQEIIPYDKYVVKLRDSKKARYNGRIHFYFCNSSCSAKHSNKVSPKRHADDVQCKGNCGKNLGKFWINKREYCEECLVVLNNRKSIVKKNLGDRTFEEYLENYKYREPANRYSAIRQNGKKVIERSGIKKCCKNCGYDKHVEVCHLKGISEFDKTCLVSEINSLDNLVYLCPNCHWEYDHKILTI